MKQRVYGNHLERESDTLRGNYCAAYINRRHFVEEKGARDDDLHVVVGADDGFIEF